jgi:putative endonuclease
MRQKPTARTWRHSREGGNAVAIKYTDTAQSIRHTASYTISIGGQGWLNNRLYILASKRNGTLYTGATSNFDQRVWQHRDNQTKGFSPRYHVHQLVYFELHRDMEQAITREKQIKKWNRKWKLRLILERNPEWLDLWEQINH